MLFSSMAIPIEVNIQHFQVFHVNKPNTCVAVTVISQKSRDLKARIPQ